MTSEHWDIAACKFAMMFPDRKHNLTIRNDVPNGYRRVATELSRYVRRYRWSIGDELETVGVPLGWTPLDGARKLREAWRRMDAAGAVNKIIDNMEYK
jgi:hypothetical protein